MQQCMPYLIIVEKARGTPAPAAQSKPGRFDNLRARLTKPSEHAEVQHVGMYAVFESTQHGFLHGVSSKSSISFSASTVEFVRRLLQRFKKSMSCEQALCACMYRLACMSVFCVQQLGNQHTQETSEFMH